MLSLKSKSTALAVLLFLFFAPDIIAQQLPWGECGIVNIYYPSGNRKKRVYFCNNGGVYPYRPGQDGDYTKEPEKAEETNTVQIVDALYPNPTSGKFTVTFSQALSNARVSVIDNSGRRIAQFKSSGTRVEFDLSPFSSGIYFIRVEHEGKVISKKVIKQ